MSEKSNQFLGKGMYTVAEAAMYCRVTTKLMTRWLFGNASAEAVMVPQFGTAERLVSFIDLVQTLAIREIRNHYKVPLPKIREAIKYAEEEWELYHPFARHHCTYLLNDKLIIRPVQDKDEFVEASGKKKGQRLIPFVEMYLKSLDFDPDGLAHKYRIFSSNHSKPVAVTMDPKVRFGEPLLPSGYTALTIYEGIKAEGGVTQAAKAYGISVKEAEAAYQFADHLSPKSAA